MTRRGTFAVAGLLGLLVLYLWTHREPDVPGGALETPGPDALGSDTGRLLAERPLAGEEGAAVLLLRPAQEPLAAARVLEAAGISFGVTRDLAAALRRPLVFIPSGDRAIRPDPAEKKALFEYAEGGGILVLQIPPDRMRELTGVLSEKPSRARRLLRLLPLSDEAFAPIQSPELREVPLASAKTRHGVWTHGLRPVPGLAQAVANFETQEAAILRRPLGKGRVYTLGFDLRDLVVRPQSGRHFDASRGKGSFDPSTDLWPLVFRGWYAAVGGRTARLRGLPGDARALLLLTHDIGWGASTDAATEFLALEKRRGVSATWFVQPKYLSDVLPAPLLDAGLRRLLARIAAQGHEIASHSVSHGPDLAALPLGTGNETVKDYRPRLDEKGRTHGGTFLGELCLSRKLLREAAPGTTVSGFRSAFLRFPVRLDAGLSRCGYGWDSSTSAEDVLGYRPFRLLRGRAMRRESELWEFPMALQDENSPDATPKPAEVLSLLGKVSALESSFVWLIHPNKSPSRFAALEEVLSGLPPGTRTWTISEAAAFEQGRSRTRFSLIPAGPGSSILRVEAPAGSKDLSFEVSAPLRGCSSATRVRCRERIVVIEGLPEGKTEIRLSWE